MRHQDTQHSTFGNKWSQIASTTSLNLYYPSLSNDRREIEFLCHVTEMNVQFWVLIGKSWLGIMDPQLMFHIWILLLLFFIYTQSQKEHTSTLWWKSIDIYTVYRKTFQLRGNRGKIVIFKSTFTYKRIDLYSH